MHDIQLVLTRYGVWAKDNSGVGWSPIAAGFKGLLPTESSKVESCCDDDGRIVDAAVERLAAARKPEGLTLIMLHYRFGLSKQRIAKVYKVSEGLIRQQLQVAEGIVDGCLAITGAVLEMDTYTKNPSVKSRLHSSSALRKNSCNSVKSGHVVTKLRHEVEY